MAEKTAMFVLFGLLFVSCSFTSASHFRGGQLIWKPDPVNPLTVNFEIQLSWRRDYTSPMCDNQTVGTNTLLGPADDVKCFKGCTGITKIVDTQIYCTEFSVADNWMIGSKKFSYTFSSPGKYEVGYKGSFWITAAPKMVASKWSVITTVDLTVRKDTGKVNNPPKMISQPIIRINNKCKNKTEIVTIPITDADNDRTHCRWAVGKDECEQVCRGLPMATLTEFPCQLAVPNDQVTSNWYIVALMMEDFAPNSNTTLSKVPLQFLVEGFQGSASCAEPTFVPPTPPDGSVFHFDSNCPGPFQINVTARPAIPIDRIDEISVVGGISKGQLVPTNNQYNDSYSIISWTPSSADQVKLLSFTAKDQTGASTTPRSVSINIYKDSNSVPNRCFQIPNCQYCGLIPPPTAIPTTPAPTGQPVPISAVSKPAAEWRYYFVLGSILFLVLCIVLAIIAYRRRTKRQNKVV